jgi:hypothetical protein
MSLGFIYDSNSKKATATVRTSATTTVRTSVATTVTTTVAGTTAPTKTKSRISWEKKVIYTFLNTTILTVAA